MKTRLIIISDLWGIKRSKWIEIYLENLNKNFNIQYYDACDLGEIDMSIYQQKNLHKQFVNHGITMAIDNLLKKEKGMIDILAFSVGGLIAWKAGLKGLKINKLYVVSSTRLRYEVHKPKCVIKLFFGENDIHKPTNGWFEKLIVEFEIVKKRNHNMYIKKDFAIKICNEINN